MTEAAAPPSWWQRRIVGPILVQLRQGITPEKIALTFALGFVCSIFPILGATTLLCGLAAFALRLNQPLIQVINYLAYPVQMLALIPFYRAGEWLFRQPPTPLSIPLLLERFRADVWKFLADFGIIALQGIAVWCLVAPLIVVAIYFTLQPALRAFALRRL